MGLWLGRLGEENGLGSKEALGNKSRKKLLDHLRYNYTGVV